MAARRIRCREHGDQAAYVACRHAAERRRPVHFVEHPSPTEVGTVACAECDLALRTEGPVREQCIQNQLVMVCAPCVSALLQQRGLAPSA